MENISRQQKRINQERELDEALDMLMDLNEKLLNDLSRFSK